jgi:catechol 2,3-dioxygenase-like lactoylglutathione lyase family enzyme
LRDEREGEQHELEHLQGENFDRGLRHGPAAEFYEGKLGLIVGEDQSDESRIYLCGGDTSLHIYESPAHAGKATATLATWYVADLKHVVDELGSKGVTFERYDDPTLKADTKGIHELGDGRVAWFKDPDGNTFAIEQ